MRVTMGGLARDIQKAIENLKPEELADYWLNMMITEALAVMSGTLTEEEQDAELDMVTAQVLRCVDRFDIDEFIQYRERWHCHFELKLLEWWNRENLSNYKVIIDLIDFYLEVLPIIRDVFMEGCDDDQLEKCTTGWKLLEENLQFLKAKYQKKRDAGLNVCVRDLLKGIKFRLDLKGNLGLSDSCTQEIDQSKH